MGFAGAEAGRAGFTRTLAGVEFLPIAEPGFKGEVIDFFARLTGLTGTVALDPSLPEAGRVGCGFFSSSSFATLILFLFSTLPYLGMPRHFYRTAGLIRCSYGNKLKQASKKHKRSIISSDVRPSSIL